MEKKEMMGCVFNECLLKNIFPTGCPHGQGGGDQPNADSCRQEKEEGSKITKNVWIFFMDDSKDIFRSRLEGALF